MSKTPLNSENINKVYNFNCLKIKEENKESTPTASGASTFQHTTKRYDKQISLFNPNHLNNNKNNDDVTKTHSTINITKIKKKFSKIKVDKNDKNQDKRSSKKLLLIFKNSQKLKNNNHPKVITNDKIIEKEGKKKRYDNFGNIINKKNKKNVHIVFKDQFNQNNIIEEIQIESYKKYNFVEGLPKDDVYNPINHTFYKCCITF